MKLTFPRKKEVKIRSEFTPSRSRLHASDLHWMIIRYSAFLALILVLGFSTHLYLEIRTTPVVDTSIDNLADLPSIAEADLLALFFRQELDADRLDQIISDPVYISDPAKPLEVQAVIEDTKELEVGEN